ncbi:glycosyltransferase family 9 protein [hot springs metagenome]|uniref:Glycosyltransferase family 9 protein n=1 Tax=hot springs metagenome TaxID=433727 RepID=A0A5J4KZY1_9ZZZZ
MIYVILTYFFSPFIYLLIFLKRKKSINKILIIQTAKIGDLICSTPVFREIKKKYPATQLTVMVNPITKELLEYNPHVDKIISLKTVDYKGFSGKLRLSNLIRRENYDIAICLNPNVSFSLALFWGLVPIRLSVMPNFTGVTFRMASIFFTHLEQHIAGRLVIETYMDMLKAIGIDSSDITKEVYKSENADSIAQQVLGSINKPLIGIAVSSGNKLKELGTEKIIKLIDMLLDNMDIYVVLIGSTQDRNAADVVLDSAAHKDRIINAAGMLNLKELPALIGRLSLFIGVDTGITYMADALNIPIINIAGPSDMQDQRPTGKNAVIIQKTDLPCVPCSHSFRSPYYCKINTRECIEKVEVREIIDAVKNFLSKS